MKMQWFRGRDLVPLGRGKDYPKILHTRSRKHCAEQGFTLVELLIVIVILPIIVGAIGLALVTVFSLQTSTANRLSDSGDAQMVSATFEKDVQSASKITIEDQSSPRCGSDGRQLLGLSWVTSSGLTIVSYDEVGSSSPYSLVRDYCTSGSLTPESSSTASFNLPSGQSLPAITCAVSQANCDVSDGWISTQGVSDVTFPINETHTNSQGGFSYTLIATPRLFNSAPGAGGGQPLYPLALLGTSANCSTASPVLDLTGSTTVTAISSDGTLLPIRIQSSCASAVTLINGETLDGTVGGIVTSDQNTTVPGTGTYCVLVNKHGTTCDSSQVGPPETYEPYQASTADPLASLSAPANPTLPAGCLNTVCPQGEEFTTAQSLSGAFGSANKTYIFDQNVSISGNVTVSFSSGTYWFKGGLSIAQATVNFGTGTYIFGSSSVTCPIVNSLPTCLSKTNGGAVTTDSNGVLFYIEAGAVTVNGSSQVSILGESSNYDVAIWDATTEPLSITNGGAAASLFGGIYIPNGQIVLSGSGAVSMSFIEANTALLEGSGAITVGVVG